ncbi:Pecanex-like protein 4 [Rhizophlyctis rosea]|nr:Pecanex-like protein 4 [Rhizophlyctis rosea]
MRLAWRDVRGLSVDLVIVFIVDAIAAEGGWWEGRNIGEKLLIVGYGRDVVERCWEKTLVWVVAVWGFVSRRKQRRPYNPLYILASLIITPPTILFTSLLDAPMLPFLGLPIFWPGFPRPARSWPGAEPQPQAPDTPLYTSLLPSLLPTLSHALSDGTIPPTSTYIARFDSRLLLLRIMETHYDTLTLLITGCEVEPTSCHALEGAEIDGVLDGVLGKGRTPRWWGGGNLGHVLWPVGTVRCEAGVEGRSVLTGVMDAPDTLKRVPKVFIQILTWKIVKDWDKNGENWTRQITPLPIPYTLLPTLTPHISTAFLTTLQTLYPSPPDTTLLLTLYTTYLGLTSPSTTPIRTLTDLYTLYEGTIPCSEGRAWLLSEERRDLLLLCLRSYRMAVYIVWREVCGEDPIGDGRELDVSLLSSNPCPYNKT